MLYENPTPTTIYRYMMPMKFNLPYKVNVLILKTEQENSSFDFKTFLSTSSFSSAKTMVPKAI